MSVCDDVESSREGGVTIATGLEGIAWVEAGSSYRIHSLFYV